MCDSNAHRGVVQCSQALTTGPAPSVGKQENESAPPPPPLSLDQAISVISASPLCSIHPRREEAVQVIASAWSESKGSPDLEKALSSPEAVESILHASSKTEDNKVAESSICILAELVSRNKVNRRALLNADPQLEIFSRILQRDADSNTLFLKAAALLYLLRPQAKQMLLPEWVPLALRVLEEHGDQTQVALFSVTCSPKSAALYLLDQLLRGCDADRSSENARRVVALGGHKLLMGALECGDVRERRSAAALLIACVRADDGSCREYLASNVNKDSVLELLEGNQLRSGGHAFALLLEVALLGRRTQITKFLIELKNGSSLNAMHILLVYLQQSPAERRPLVASILLQLDLLGDSSRFSIYREEAVESIVTALASKNGRKVQEQCGRALLVLAGRFSKSGEPWSEEWFLEKAGFRDECPADSCEGEGDTAGEDKPRELDEEDRETENWLRRLSVVLLTRGNERFLASLSDCIANGTPTMARSCLVTAAWMSSSISPPQNAQYFWYVARPALLPQLLECLGHHGRSMEDRVLASVSILNFARDSGCFSEILPLDSDTKELLQDLSRFTWTAKETLRLAAAAASDPTAAVSDKPNAVSNKPSCTAPK